MKLIDKDALVAEVKNWIQDARHRYTMSKIQFSLSDMIETLEKLISSLDTIEVKEVDLENSVKGIIDYPFIGADFPTIYPNYKELKDYCDKNDIKDEDEVKIILIKVE